MKKNLLCSIALTITISMNAQENLFEGLGYLPSTANFYSIAEGVSEDGSIIIGTSSVGEGSREAFRWENGEMHGIGVLDPENFYSRAYAVSGNGNVIVGHSKSESSFSQGYEAMKWTEEEGMQGLGDFAPPFFNEATDVSADGNIIVGRSFFTGQGFRWENGVMESMYDGENFLGWSMGVSADGSVVVGTGVVDDLVQACLWREGEGIIGLGGADNSTTSTAYKVSADGSIVVGVKAMDGDSLEAEAFLWTQEDGMTGLGFLSSNHLTSQALDLSDDGTTVVGYSHNDEGGDEAFIWTEENGMRNLKEVLENDYGLDLTGWTLRKANAITGNGNTIVGFGINPDGNAEAWRAVISANIEPMCEQPTDIIVNNITTTTAGVIWVENGEATQWEIEYGETGFTQGEGIIIEDNDGEIGETIDGLEPATQYDAYVRAICNNGESDWAGPVSFTTEIPPCPQPSDIIVDTITPNMVYVSWTENGDATQWEIEYGETGFIQGEGTTILDNDGMPGEAISGLEEGIDYDVYVRAICEFSESEWIGPVTFNTDEMGINELGNQMVLYPNPTSGIINIQAKEKINSVSVYNSVGQKVPFNSLNKENTSIDISNLSSGIYFLEIYLNNKTIKKYKVIKK
jgi:probable HAF family extracellular repeat protein